MLAWRVFWSLVFNRWPLIRRVEPWPAETLRRAWRWPTMPQSSQVSSFQKLGKYFWMTDREWMEERMIDKWIMIGHFYISWDNCEYNSELNHITNVFLLSRFYWLWIIFSCHRKPLDYRWNLSPERNLYSDSDYFTHLANLIGSVPDPKDPNFFGPPGSWSVIYLYLYFTSLWPFIFFEEWCKCTFKKE